MPSGSAARILELRGEREVLEARLAEISSDIDAEVVVMLRAGITGQEIAAVCGWSKQRVSQIRARALGNAAPDLGPGEAELALHRSEIASKGGKAAAVARRTRKTSGELLESFGIVELAHRADALRFVARATADELRPLSRVEALEVWVSRRAEARELASVS